MTIFDRFFSQTSLVMDDRYCQLIALSCHNLAKKLRTNLSVNNENEQTSLILLDENYSDEEIFVSTRRAAITSNPLIDTHFLEC